MRLARDVFLGLLSLAVIFGLILGVAEGLAHLLT